MRGLAALGVDLPADAFAYRTAVKEALARTREHMDARQFRFGPGHVLTRLSLPGSRRPEADAST